MKLRKVRSVEELVRVLGGPKAASEFFDGTPQKVVNWKAEKRLPSRLYLVHRDKLLSRGIAAPATLWGMVEAAE